MLLSDKSGERSMPEGQEEQSTIGYVLNASSDFLSPPFSSSFIEVDFQDFGEMSYKNVSLEKEQTENKQS